jgi:hypothetical protein
MCPVTPGTLVAADAAAASTMVASGQAQDVKEGVTLKGARHRRAEHPTQSSAVNRQAAHVQL